MNMPVQESPAAPHPPTPHQPRRTVHTVIIAVVAVIALPIVLIGIFFVGSITIQFIRFEQRPFVGDAITAAERYYQALQRQDYTTAYSYLDQHATLTIDGRATPIGSADDLAAAARTLNQRYGAIEAYISTDGMFEQGKDVVDMTMHIRRAASEYDVHIQISWVGGNQVLVDKTKWKILQASGI